MLDGKMMSEKYANYPVFYSFRRCPYAMRARLAISAARQKCILREIVLRDKPEEMLALSPKGTVPVLHLPDGTVVDESLDIMLWALGQNDPQGWLPLEKGDQKVVMELIAFHDETFKFHLDRYKYPNRYQNVDGLYHRSEAETILSGLEERLRYCENLLDKRPTLIDFALFPFVRQFANVDRVWFDALPYPHLQRWLETHLASGLFLSVMTKYRPWKETGERIVFPGEKIIP